MLRVGWLTLTLHSNRINTIEGEYKKQVEKLEQALGGLVEYIIALANDQIKCADYAEALMAWLKRV